MQFKDTPWGRRQAREYAERVAARPPVKEAPVAETEAAPKKKAAKKKTVKKKWGFK
tara:strand:+ start:898 stop:1065 length:168 start_codon:yes stop_codon:yes gene_type:complete